MKQQICEFCGKIRWNQKHPILPEECSCDIEIIDRSESTQENQYSITRLNEILIDALTKIENLAIENPAGAVRIAHQALSRIRNLHPKP